MHITKNKYVYKLLTPEMGVASGEGIRVATIKGFISWEETVTA